MEMDEEKACLGERTGGRGSYALKGLLLAEVGQGEC